MTRLYFMGPRERALICSIPVLWATCVDNSELGSRCELAAHLNAARERISVAHALTDLPLIHDSFSKGEISFLDVRAMSRVATTDNESFLLMISIHGTAAHVEFIVRGYRRAKADLEPDEANNRYERRQLNWYFDDYGMVVLKVR
ncbi:MAG: hypothetical protein ACI8W7_003983 [Gammaproteobacteria bacterium]|jgi:hypothetical protein